MCLNRYSRWPSSEDEPGQHQLAVLEPVRSPPGAPRCPSRAAARRARARTPARRPRRAEARAFGGVEQVDARGEHRLDAVRDLELLDAAGRAPVAFERTIQAARRSACGGSPRGRTDFPRRAPDAGVHRGGRSSTASRSGDERSISSSPSGSSTTLESSAGRLPSPGAPRRQLGPRRADEQQRALGPLRDLLEQVEQRRVGPVDVLDDHDAPGRAAARRGEERAATPLWVSTLTCGVELAQRHVRVLDADGVGERRHGARRVGAAELVELVAAGADLGDARRSGDSLSWTPACRLRISASGQ